MIEQNTYIYIIYICESHVIIEAIKSNLDDAEEYERDSSISHDFLSKWNTNDFQQNNSLRRDNHFPFCGILSVARFVTEDPFQEGFAFNDHSLEERKS